MDFAKIRWIGTRECGEGTNNTENARASSGGACTRECSSGDRSRQRSARLAMMAERDRVAAISSVELARRGYLGRNVRHATG